MRLAELLGISLGTQNLCTNILFFLLEFWFGRKYIGLGTFVNGICIGYIVTAFYDPFTPTSATRRRWRCSWRGSSRRCWSRRWALRSTRPRPRHRALRLPFPRSAGLHTLPVLRVSHLHRCAQRPAVLAAGWPCGLGTLICAFCLGPFIQFFDRTFSQKVLQYKPNN